MSQNSTPKNKGTRRVFKNPILERLSRTHISLPLIIFSFISTYLVYVGYSSYDLSALTIVLYFLFGMMTFSFIEYIMHRFVFHMAETSPARKKFVYTAHGVHHEYPKDKDRLAMPIPASVFLSYVFFLGFELIFGSNVYAFLPGFLMGYSSYLWVHYMVHAFQPPKNFFKFFWVHHGVHHYKQPERAFGVSSPFWDMIFRTMPK